MHTYLRFTAIVEHLEAEVTHQLALVNASEIAE